MYDLIPDFDIAEINRQNRNRELAYIASIICYAMSVIGFLGLIIAIMIYIVYGYFAN
jgi:biopolymer transport protein ExbB/TolQ